MQINSYKHGAYYYRVPKEFEPQWDGKTDFRLGKTLAEAYRVWALRFDRPEDIRLLGELFDRYSSEVVPRKAPKTQASNQTSLKRLRTVFSSVPVAAIRPKHAYKYRDVVTNKHGPASANRDLEVLSHALSKAVEWGIIDRNPIKGQVRKNSIKRRERYIEDWELEEALSVASPFLRSYIVVKLLTGLRRGDLLRLTVTNLRGDGIHVETSKTGARIVIEWTDELTTAIEAALGTRPKDTAPWVFCTRDGRCFVKSNGTASGFDSLWRRYMRRVMTQTKLVTPFQEKDLRKKTASDMTLDDAQRLLGHNDAATTHRHYRIVGERVAPHSLQKRR